MSTKLCCGKSGWTEGAAPVSISEVVRSVNALVEKAQAAEQRDPFAGRRVVAAFMAPSADGEPSKVIKVVSDGKDERQFAVPQRYWLTSNAAVDQLLSAPARSKLPTTLGEADELERERATLRDALPGLDRGERQKAEDRILAIEDLLRRWRKLDQVERARQ